MKNEINKKNYRLMIVVSVISMLLLVALTVPTIYISKYAYPWADDFSYAAETRHTYLETGSVLKAAARAVETSMESYFDWQGTYSSCFLMAMQPAVFGTKYYHLTGFIMLGAMFAAYLALFWVLCYKALHFTKTTTLTMFSLTYIASVQMVKSIPEAFTWFNGAVHYTFNHSMFILFLALTILLYMNVSKKDNGVAKVIKTALLCVFGFLVAGGNNITVLTGTVILVMLVASVFLYYRFYKKESVQKYALLVPVVLSFIIGAMVNFGAPGNKERMEAVGDHNSFVGTVIASFISGGYSVYYNFTVELFVILVLVAIICWFEISKGRALQHVDFKFPLPGIVLLLSFCILSAQYAPVNFTSVQDNPNDIIISGFSLNRVNNCIYYNFVLLVIFDEIYFMGWLWKKNILKRVPNSIFAFAGVLLIIVGMINAQAKIKVKPESFTASASVYNLQSGSAQYYGNIMKENISRLEKEDKEVLVWKIDVYPSSLLPKDAADWKDGVKHFYGKESVEYEE